MKKIKKNILFSTLGVIGVTLLCSPLFFLNNKNNSFQQEQEYKNPQKFFNSVTSIDSFEKVPLIRGWLDLFQASVPLNENRVFSRIGEGEHGRSAGSFYMQIKNYSYFVIKKNNIDTLDSYFFNINADYISLRDMQNIVFEQDGQAINTSSAFEAQLTMSDHSLRGELEDTPNHSSMIFNYDGLIVSANYFIYMEGDNQLTTQQYINKHKGEYIVCEVYTDIRIDVEYFNNPDYTERVTLTLNEINGNILPFAFTIA